MLYEPRVVGLTGLQSDLLQTRLRPIARVLCTQHSSSDKSRLRDERIRVFFSIQGWGTMRPNSTMSLVDSELVHTNCRSRALDADSPNSKAVQSVKRINKNGTTPYKYNDRRMSRQNVPANRSFKLNASSSNSNASIKPVSFTFVPVPIIVSVRARIIPSVIYSVPVAIAWPHTTWYMIQVKPKKMKRTGKLSFPTSKRSRHSC